VILGRRLDARDERGATILVVVLALVAIFGMVVLVVDIGGALVVRRQMVRSADAAALAAAYSFAKDEAICDQPLTWPTAQQKAAEYAVYNADGTLLTSFTPKCDQSTVTVDVQSRTVKYIFAPIIGGPSERTVPATATAVWGPLSGGNPMPIELDPVLTRNCVYVDPNTQTTFKPPGPCPTGYWFDNQDLTNSGWGLMNLASWGVDPGANCNNVGGADQLGDWITQADPISVALEDNPTYVCTTDGGKTPNWVTDLASWAGSGKVFLFPINDPAQMVYGPPTSQQKYAIIGLAPMVIVAVYDVGKDPDAAIGTQSSCTGSYSFTSGNTTVDLDTVVLPTVSGSCPNGTVTPSDIGTPTLLDPATGKKINSGWSYDASTHVITWTAAVPKNVNIQFDWRGGGACPGHAPDPNAYCLVLSWGGPQVITGPPDPDAQDFGARGIRLIR